MQLRREEVANRLLRWEIIEDFVAPEKAGRERIVVIGEGRWPKWFEAFLVEPAEEGGVLGLEEFIRPPSAEADRRAARWGQFS